MAKVVRVTEPVSAKEMTEARMGPTQGVHNRPSPNPKTKPPKKPSLPVDLSWGKRAKIFSTNAWKPGRTKDKPKVNMTMTERRRSESAGMPVALTRRDKKR